MTARAPSESQPQQKLSWDNEGRLTAWQNAPSSPTSTAQYLYDGEGNRVEQQTTTGGTTTTTVYIGSLESVSTTGGTSTTTTYYYAAGPRIALAVNGTLSYLASDLLGSATVALDGSGTPTASQLYAPYGGTRFSNGTMPTDYGFTGQRADASTGLDYYGARYYDPTLGQFTSADNVLDGLNRYGYVGGNPINRTDPSGHRAIDCPGCMQDDGGVDASDVPAPTDYTDHPPNHMFIPGDVMDSRPWSDIPGRIYWRDDLGTTWKNADGTGGFRAYGGDLNLTYDEDGNIATWNGTPESQRIAAQASMEASNLETQAMGVDDAGVVNAPNPTADDTSTSGGSSGGGKGGGGSSSNGSPTLYRGQTNPNRPPTAPPSSDDLRLPPSQPQDIKPKGGMVGPSFTGKQGFSTFDGMNPTIKAGSWWSVSASDLPEGLTAFPGNAPRIIGGQAYLHYSIAPAVDMTLDEYMNLLDQIQWDAVP